MKTGDAGSVLARLLFSDELSKYFLSLSVRSLFLVKYSRRLERFWQILLPQGDWKVF
jgi:hypothetical protein